MHCINHCRSAALVIDDALTLSDPSAFTLNVLERARKTGIEEAVLTTKIGSNLNRPV